MLPLTVTMGMKVDMGSSDKNESLLLTGKGASQNVFTSVFCCRDP